MIRCFRAWVLSVLLLGLYLYEWLKGLKVSTIIWRSGIKNLTFALPLCVALLVFKEWKVSSLRIKVVGIQRGGMNKREYSERRCRIGEEGVGFEFVF